MPERYDRQRDYRDSGRDDRARNDRSGGYSRSSSSSDRYAGASRESSGRAPRSSYPHDYSSQGRPSQASRRPYPDASARQASRRERPAYDSASRTYRGSAGENSRPRRESTSYRADDYRASQSDRNRARSGQQGYRTTSSASAQRRAPRQPENYRRSGGYSRQGQGRDAYRDSRSSRPRDTYRDTRPADRPVEHSKEYARDAFDPRTNVRGGRSVRAAGIQGGGPHMSGRFQGGRSLDVTDIFQMGKFALIGLVAILVIIFIGRAVYLATPSTYTVNGQEVELARGTTYQGLVDTGALDVTRGNLVAVDGEVLQEQGGKDPTVFLAGEQVQDMGAMISDQGDITGENGEDEIEPYSATQEITPIVTQLQQQNEFNFYNGVLHVVTDPGQEGIVETRTGETTGKTATVKVQDMKPRLIEDLDASLSSDNKLVALTFDDGPNPISGGTEEVLAALAKYNAKATFFMLGTQVEEYPEEAKKVADAGHQVASHSYSHDAEHYFNQTSEDDVKHQIQHAREVISSATGIDPMYIRPPGGNVDAKAVMAADTLADGYIGWSIDTLDYELPGVDAIVNTVESEIAPGAVILMHDGGGDRTQTAEALEKFIPSLQAKGYKFVTIDELVQAIIAERGGSANSTQAPTGEQGAQPGAEQNADAGDGQNADAGNGDTGDGQNAEGEQA